MIDIKIYNKPQVYDTIYNEMIAYHKKIATKEANEAIWLFEHYPVYTIGTSGLNKDIVNIDENIPILETSRGGQVTWHGFGQRVVWIMLNLKLRKIFIKELVSSLQDWIILSLNDLIKLDRNLQSIEFFKNPDFIGVWAKVNDADTNLSDKKSLKHNSFKIAAIGLRVSKGISMHGLAINVNPELKYYKNIIPCGINQPDLKVGSLESFNIKTNFKKLDKSLISNFSQIFNIKTRLII